MTLPDLLLFAANMFQIQVALECWIEGAPTLPDSMDGAGEHYAKRNKPGGARQVPYDLTYKWKLMNKTKQTNTKSKQNRTRNME